MIQAGDRANIRILPQDSVRSAIVLSLDGSRIELQPPAGEMIDNLPLQTPVEVSSDAWIALGIVESSGPDGVAVLIEHWMERSIIAELQTAWREAGLNA